MLKFISSNFFIANAVGFIFGLGVCHPLIAHGITGEHERWLTPMQWIMHIIALFFFASFYWWITNQYILTSQMKALVSRKLLLLIIPQVLFWTGYIALDIPFDILFMSLSIAVINAYSLKENFKKRVLWFMTNIVFVVVGFALASFLGYALYDYMTANNFHAHDLVGDFMIWLTISTSICLLYGSFTSWYIGKYSIAKN